MDADDLELSDLLAAAFVRGIANPVLRAECGLEVVALEPSVEMAAVARRNCARFPHVAVTDVTIQNWPAEREAFQLVVSAQAWHWIAAEVRYSEARDVLTPGGALAVFWNRPLWDDTVLRAALDDVYER